jgi:hypothetical protein
MVEYRHGFSAALAHGLHSIYLANKTINLKHLNLTRNQWDNFQKLRYWGLVQKAINENGSRNQGCWSITQKGKDFVDGKILIPKGVWTYRGETVRFEGDDCKFNDVHEPTYKQRVEYAEESVAH